MEQEYLIGTTNKFLALIDSDDAFESLKNIDAEKQKKKALKTQTSNDNKENKGKDNEARVKAAPRKPAAAKPTDRVLTADRNVKAETQPERPNTSRNREERGPARERNSDFPRSGNFREGGKPEGGPPRGPRPDGPRGEKRDGPRPPRVDGEGRPFRGLRPDGESRPYRGDRQDGESRPFRGDRGDRQPGSDGERPPRRERREFTEGSDAEGRSDRRPPGRGRGGPRPPGRNYDNRGKREFDRKSGSDRTGVKAVDKRDGAGPYNWDSNKDPEAQVADLNVTNQSDEMADWDDAPQPPKPVDAPEPKEGGETSADETPAVPAEEEVKELTLDEYRALRGKRELPRYDIRKPGEGEDLTRWKNMVEIKKKVDDEHTDEELELPEFPQRVGRQRHVMGIDITFKDSFRGGRRGRGSGPPGGRGGGRGRDGGRDGGRDRDGGHDGGRDGGQQRRFPREDRGDRGDRGERGERGDRGPRQSAPKVDDEKDFPSLG